MKDTLISTIKSDLGRIDEAPSLLSFFRHYLFPRGEVFKYVFWLRVTAFWKKKGCIGKYTFGVISYMFLRHYEYKYGIHANSNIRIGKGLHIVHGGAVYLNCKEIGSNVTIYQSVTLGSNGQCKGVPTIEDNVTIYVGSVVAGDIVLHHDCVVAANSFVNKSVDTGICVGGTPAKPLKFLPSD